MLGALVLDALPAAMQPVLFDKAAAQAAATAYRRAARVVDRTAAARAGDVGAARGRPDPDVARATEGHRDDDPGYRVNEPGPLTGAAPCRRMR